MPEKGTYISIEEWYHTDDNGNIVTFMNGSKLRVVEYIPTLRLSVIQPKGYMETIDLISDSAIDAHCVKWKPARLEAKAKKAFVATQALKKQLEIIRMPFGKYKGVPLSLVDLLYLDWLLGQEWFMDKFASLYKLVDNYLHLPNIKRDLELAMEKESNGPM